MLASLLVIGSILLVGLGNGIAVTASAVGAVAPVGSSAIADDVTESKVDTSTRRRAARRMTPRSGAGRRAGQGSGRKVFVERLLVRLLRLAPPSWRGPLVLLM